MQCWEYLRINRSREVKQKFASSVGTDWEPEVDENKLGRQGWELVSIVAHCSECHGT